MDRNEAASVLGVGVDSDDAEVRAAYRRRIRDRHPDRAGAAATAEASRIIEAWTVLRGADPGGPTRADADATPSAGTDVSVPDDDTLAVALPVEEVFLLLLETAHEVGDVTYVDPEAGLLEALVTVDGGPVCSLVLSLQGRGDRVEAFATLESLERRPAPPVGDIVALLAAVVRRRLATHM